MGVTHGQSAIDKGADGCAVVYWSGGGAVEIEL